MAPHKIRFSNRRIADLDTPKDVAAWYYDSETPGFAVTISPLGKRAFYFYGRAKGRPQRIKVGSFPQLSVGDARKLVLAIVGDIARGKDVAERKRTGRATVNDLFEHYLVVHARPKKRTWERDQKEYDRLLKPEFGAVPLGEVERDDIEKLIARIEDDDGRGPARKARALLSKMFEVGIVGKWCAVNPVRGTRRPEFDERQRYLKTDEVAAFLKAVAALESDNARDFFRLCLFTGARRSNVASMRWDELDLSLGLWLIPAAKSKGKKPHTIPLSSFALEIIRSRRNNRSPWVLPGRSRAGHYTEPKDAWRRVLKLSGLTDLRIHDLRRSLGAWQQAGGASLKTISETLGHSDVRVTAKFYTPVAVEQVRQASEAAINALMEAGR